MNIKKLVIKGCAKRRPILDKYPNLISLPTIELKKLGIDFSNFQATSYMNGVNPAGALVSLFKCKLVNLRCPLPRQPIHPNLKFISTEFEKPQNLSRQSSFMTSSTTTFNWTTNLTLVEYQLSFLT